MAAKTVQVDDAGVRRTLGGLAGGREEVRWEELRRVEILTTGDGPFAEDFFWVLDGDGREVVLGQAEATAVDLLGHLGRRLPGFDREAVLSACGSTEDARFLCWEISWSDRWQKSGRGPAAG